MAASFDIKCEPAGHATLEVEQVAGESAVTSAYASNPLKLLTPRSRGQSVWAFASSFGGGLVAGDQTRLDVRVGAGARCFVGTQASAKIYRNPSCRPCGHVTQARLEAGALLVFAPEPVQPFAHSSYTQRQEFHLGESAGLVLLDWFCSGRAARGERWAFTRLQTRNEVWNAADKPKETANSTPSPLSDGGEGRGEEEPFDAGHLNGTAPPSGTLLAHSSRGESARSSLIQAIDPRSAFEKSFPGSTGDPPVPSGESPIGAVESPALPKLARRIFLDSLLLDSTDGLLGNAHRTGRFNCFALLLVLGAPVHKIAAQMLGAVSRQPVIRGATLLFSASEVSDGALLRVAAEKVEDARRELRRHLEPVVELLGDDPFARKW